MAPNKHTSAGERMYKGHLLESETYIGGKVEAIESGECVCVCACTCALSSVPTGCTACTAHAHSRKPPICRLALPPAGVFRSDLPTRFRCKAEGYQVGLGEAWLRSRRRRPACCDVPIGTYCVASHSTALPSSTLPLPCSA